MERDQSTERRNEPRTKVGLDVVFSFGLDRARATLRDLSASGAVLEPASICPEVGEIVTLFLEGGLDEEPESVHTEVVRHTKEAFAVAFCLPRSIVNDIVAQARSDRESSKSP